MAVVAHAHRPSYHTATVLYTQAELYTQTMKLAVAVREQPHLSVAVCCCLLLSVVLSVAVCCAVCCCLLLSVAVCCCLLLSVVADETILVVGHDIHLTACVE